MSRNHTKVPASVFALRAFAVINAIALTGAFYTGHEALWSLSIVLSLAILAAFGQPDSTMHGPRRTHRDAHDLSSLVRGPSATLLPPKEQRALPSSAFLSPFKTTPHHAPTKDAHGNDEKSGHAHAGRLQHTATAGRRSFVAS